MTAFSIIIAGLMVGYLASLIKQKEDEDDNHEDGSLKWTWLECDGCGRATEAYCYEYQSTDYWNKGKAERRTDE